VLRRGLAIARSSGNKGSESHLAVILTRVAAMHGDPMDALEFVTVALPSFYDSGSFSLMPSPLAIFAALLDRLNVHKPAAILSGFAVNLLTPRAFPEISRAITHLREVLGAETYESLARSGRHMSPAEAASFAFDQIDRARAHVSATAGLP
jgi:hypothetical protein